MNEQKRNPMKELSNLLGQALTRPESSTRQTSFEAATQSKQIPGLYMNEKGFFDSVVPLKYRGVTLENCEKQPQAFRDYAASWAKRPVSVVLMGPVGRGKTQFAFAMIREAFKHCKPHFWPRYFTSPQLDSILLECIRSDNGDKQKIQDLGEEDMLFIDDFGERQIRNALRDNTLNC